MAGDTIVVPALVNDICHAYILHNTADIDFARDLQKDLGQRGFKCLISEEIAFGKPEQLSIADAMAQSRRSFIIISPKMMKSRWIEFQVANSRAKVNEKKEVTFIPVLHGISADKIPTYVKEIFYLESVAENFHAEIVRCITDSLPLADTVPAGNVAHGIAWSYFYGFLSFVLPALNRRLLQSEFAGRDIKLMPKMIIVLPETCSCPSNLKEVDECVTHEGFVDFTATRAGKVNRNYKNSVYKVKDPRNGEEFYTVMEYATPLLSLYEMEQGRLSDFDTDAKLKQMGLFQQKMQEILDHPSNKDCHGTAVLVRYRDYSTPDCPQQRLAQILCDCIRSELDTAVRVTDESHSE